MATRWNIVLFGCLFLQLVAFIESGDVWIEPSRSQLLPKILDGSVMLQLPSDLVLLDVRYPANTPVWVSSNGYLTFGSKFNESAYRKATLPISDKDGDPLLIAAFRARTQYRPDESSDTLASVSYSLDLDGDSLAQLNTIIRSTVAGKRLYVSNQEITVSWSHISFFGGTPASTPYPRNTFQVVITSDGEYTFAVFNYKSIVWDGGHANGGDQNTGIGANNPPAQAGINTGAGRGFINLDYRNNTLDIDIEQASQTAGQYVYELSSPVPVAHGCSTKTLGTQALHIFPSSGPMFGGNPVEISDVCLLPEQSIECQFGDQVVTGAYLTPSRALCYTPTFYANQQYRFKLLVEGKELKSGATFYFVSINIPNRVKLVDVDSWRSLSPKNKRLNITWNPLDLFDYKGKLAVKLFTYSENDTSYGWKEELIIADGISNSGFYNFDTSGLNCAVKCGEKTVGAIVLELVDSPDVQYPGRLWSNVGPLGWYVDSYLRREIGNRWPGEMCYNWFVKDTKEDFDWLKELEDCPCTKEQAVGDIGRFIPDPGCNMYNKKSNYNCYYHQGADHCVRSIWPSKPTGAGTQCCYGSDGNLMYAGDSIYGSTVDKGHSQGAKPYNAPGHVPSLSHWIHDVVTYQYCCLWNLVNSTCGIYMDQRPTKDCDAYEAVQAAGLYGDTNIETFNGINFTYNKPGVYSLLESAEKRRKVEIQVKLTAVPSTSLTMLTGILINGETSSVEITVNAADRLQRTVVKVDGVERRFADPAWFKQQYTDVQISSWDITPVTDHSNFTISLQSGLGLRVTAHQYNLNVIVTAPESLVEQIKPTSLLAKSGNIKPQSALLTTSPLYVTQDNDGFKKGSNVTASLISQNADTSQWITTLREFTKAVVSCGMPVTHGIREGTNYLENSTVRITSCRHGYDLMKSEPGQIYTCNSSGVWEPEVKPSCQYSGFPEFEKSDVPVKEKSKTEKDELALPLALSIVGVLILVFVGAGIIYKLRKRRLESENKRHESADEEQETMTSPYEMASTGSMQLSPAATAGYQNHENLGANMEIPGGGKSYRVAVDPLLDEDQQSRDSYHSVDHSVAHTNTPGRYRRADSPDLNLEEVK